MKQRFETGWANLEIIGSPEWYLESFRLATQKARNSHEMVLYSQLWHSTPEALDFWVKDALYWRQESRLWATRYRAQVAVMTAQRKGGRHEAR